MLQRQTCATAHAHRSARQQAYCTSMSARAAAFKAVVDALKARGKTTTVVESTAGGLISSSIMAVEGSSAVYQGGSVAYNTRKCQPVLLNDAELHASLPERLGGGRRVVQSVEARLDGEDGRGLLRGHGDGLRRGRGRRGGADVPAEGAGFGVLGHRRGRAGGDGIKVVRQTLCESPHARRGDNMERFATAAARVTGGGDGDGLDRCAGERDDAAGHRGVRGKVRRYLRRLRRRQGALRGRRQARAAVARRCGALRRRRNGHVPGHPRRRAALRRRRDPRDGRRPL